MSGFLRSAGLFVVIVFLSANNAFAYPEVWRMTCAQAQQFVRERGAVILSTGPHTYSRFVATRGYCQYFEKIKPQWAQTADKKQCPVAYQCYDPIRFRIR